MLEDFKLEQLVGPLLEWYAHHARVLPWREEPTPYRVWVSEIMLQQTRVEAVKPYFERFVQELPDVCALASCEEEKLLKLWEGLGYYNRVRNMQAAARTVVSEYGGRLPADYGELLKLKGIGHYTAGAIASIAYGIPVPAVDGNVFRILMRAAEDSSDICKQSVKAKVENLLQPIIPAEQAGKFTQAMMELGATVCVPNGEPHCVECPWGFACLAKKHGTILQFPVKQKAKPRKIEKRTVLLIRDSARILLHKRPKKGLLAGMYEFPNLDGHLTEEEALEFVRARGLTPLRIEPLGDAKHIFSHIEWHMVGYMIRLAQPADVHEEQGDYLFAEARDSAGRYAIPSAFTRYRSYIEGWDAAKRSAET